MENINIGLVNLIISNKLKESYLKDDNLIEESKKSIMIFFDIIKKSPILQLEFKVFNNIENKHIPNELTASRYIDNNIKLFETYTIEEIQKERNLLNNLIKNENLSIDDKKNELYNAINNLIIESLNTYESIDVDKIHESFTYVLNYILEPKNINNYSLVENYNSNDFNEDIIEIAVDKFNNKYDSLINEEDKKLLQLLIKSKISEKKELLENYKTENLDKLNNLNKIDIKDNITKAIQKINEMKYNPNTIDDDIISLYELKNNLIEE